MKTTTEVKQDENFLCGLEFKREKVSVYTVYTGSQYLKYYLFKDEKILFEGNDFKPSLMHNIDSLNSLVSLLGFLTLEKGDTDDEYFKDYTKEQFEWSESCENQTIKLIVSDFDCGESEYMKEAKKRLQRRFIR